MELPLNQGHYGMHKRLSLLPPQESENIAIFRIFTKYTLCYILCVQEKEKQQ